jgi:2-polyprenyl-3-methyl-5-hydroxy-6-metoxy-1,4-benzoquinol methylase
MTVDPSSLETLEAYPNLARLLQRQFQVTPSHIRFLTRRYSGALEEELIECEVLAGQIARLAGEEIDEFLSDYDFICTIQRDEELYFRRHREYRLKTFEQAFQQVYSNRAYMQRYMRGLLMTQMHWSNHTSCIAFYSREFLGRNKSDVDLLEIGPGHGLLMARAVKDGRCKSVNGWDVSEASLQETAEALKRLGVTTPVSLKMRDLFAPSSAADQFDAVVFSEVLEHLEKPAAALDAIYQVMRPSARLYVNVPINSPAPDHLFLLKSPEETIKFISSRGFEIERFAFHPATNYTIEQSRKHDLTISVCVIATKPG